MTRKRIWEASHSSNCTPTRCSHLVCSSAGPRSTSKARLPTLRDAGPHSHPNLPMGSRTWRRDAAPSRTCATGRALRPPSVHAAARSSDSILGWRSASSTRACEGRILLQAIREILWTTAYTGRSAGSPWRRVVSAPLPARPAARVRLAPLPAAGCRHRASQACAVCGCTMP